MSEAALGQMMEPVAFPEFKERTEDLGWTFDGTNRPHGRIENPEKPGFVRNKIKTMEENEQQWESYMVEDAEYIFVAFGLPSRTTRNAVEQPRGKGRESGSDQTDHRMAVPGKGLCRSKKGDIKGLISVESTDAGQLIEDVALTAKKTGHGNAPVYGLFSGQNIPKTKEIIEYFEGIKAGQMKEVF